MRKCTILLPEHLYTIQDLDVGVGEQRHGPVLSKGIQLAVATQTAHACGIE